MLHVLLEEPTTEGDLTAEFSAYGAVMKVTMHPNLKEALVLFRELVSAVAAKAKSPRRCAYAQRDTNIISHELVRECWDMGAAPLRRRGAAVVEVEEAAEDIARAHDAEALARRRRAAMPKRPVYPYWQFYNVRRLEAIYAEECAVALRNFDRRQAPAPTPAPDAVVNVDGSDAAPTAAAGASEQPGDAAAASEFVPETLDPALQAEKEELLRAGFPDWTMQDHKALRQALQQGVHRTNFFALSVALGGAHSPSAVQRYVDALFERGPAVMPQWDRFEAALARHQAAADKQRQVLEACRRKVEGYQNPSADLTFNATSRLLTADLDRRLFLAAYEQGMRFTPRLVERLKRLPAVRYDSFVQSRPAEFFERRLRDLTRSVVAETEKAGARRRRTDDN
jgi:hypothetical protein